MELYTYVHMYVATFVIHRKTANRHFLNSMARVGAGCDEFLILKLSQNGKER